MKAIKMLYVKELSKLTSVSIRTLHYYDKIGLLKPSNRLPNGYRVYADKDLSRLEKIIVLKFFGFTLSRIKQLLTNESSTLEQLESQLVLLQSEVSFIQEAQRNLLIASINEYKKKRAVNWHEIVGFILDLTETSKQLRFQAAKGTTMNKASHESGASAAQIQDAWQKLFAKIRSYQSENS